MATETWAGSVSEIRAASASGGTAISTTPAFIEIPKGSRRLFLTPRNFVGSTVLRFLMNPYLVVLKTTDAFGAAANTTDYSEQAQDGDTSTVVTLSALSTAANLDFLYIGSWLPFRGVRVVMSASVNAVAATLAVNYWNGTTFTNITPTDGTASAGATFGQTGNVTWTVPTAWKRASLVDAIGAAVATVQIPYSGMPLYWTRWDVSATLSATVTATSMVAMNRSTAYAEMPVGQSLELTVQRSVDGFSVIEAATDAGTANLILNVGAQPGGYFL